MLSLIQGRGVFFVIAAQSAQPRAAKALNIPILLCRRAKGLHTHGRIFRGRQALRLCIARGAHAFFHSAARTGKRQSLACAHCRRAQGAGRHARPPCGTQQHQHAAETERGSAAGGLPVGRSLKPRAGGRLPGKGARRALNLGWRRAKQALGQPLAARRLLLARKAGRQPVLFFKRRALPQHALHGGDHILQIYAVV